MWPYPRQWQENWTLKLQHHTICWRTFRVFLAIRLGQNHRCNVFLAKKCDNAELAHSRQMALLRRHFEASSQAAHLTVPWVLLHFNVFWKICEFFSMFFLQNSLRLKPLIWGHFRSAGICVFRISLVIRVSQNHRCGVFLAKKCDNTEVAHSRQLALSWRHFDASSRVANPTVSRVLFHF